MVPPFKLTNYKTLLWPEQFTDPTESGSATSGTAELVPELDDIADHEAHHHQRLQGDQAAQRVQLNINNLANLNPHDFIFYVL